MGKRTIFELSFFLKYFLKLTEISEPSVLIKEKIEEIEQYRTDEEVTVIFIRIKKIRI